MSANETPEVGRFEVEYLHYLYDHWRDYQKRPTLKNLNTLHLAASIMYAKLSTYVQARNAKGE